MRAAFSMVDSDPKKNSKSDTRERVRGDKLSRLDRKDRKNLYLRLNGAGSFGRRQSSAMYGVKIQEVSKKLALWHTPTFSPIMSHDDLEPILCSVGFISPANVPQPSTSTNLNQPSSPSRSPPADVKWKEYAFPSSAAAVSGFFPPRPRLPFPMIWGLHLIAYKAFLSALECYIDPTDVSNLFHVRAMSITPMPEEEFEKEYRPMKDMDADDCTIYVYRKGTVYNWMLEQITALEYRTQRYEEDDDPRIKSGGSNTDQIFMVSWDNLLPERYVTSPCPSPENAEK
ncbi:uncharacterized protein LOC110098934 [Dendrobium catenatum]|uniref:uncharacterized protein LOC110098934 n=1 Tax=Dendrobium catenatum TaxID=906689 RepID=UPI0009F4045D|nr:uncharacterized protein LOC110098934 [Dendrobium catenatum]